uniref:Uncharacterized protein n=1 Tax=Oryctolagus cuniculus TaxID=9986 RepID=A0A5F9D856_RABIT
MAIPAMKVSPAKDRRICLLTLSRVPLMVSPTSACPYLQLLRLFSLMVTISFRDPVESS